MLMRLVNNMLIYFIGYDKSIVFDCQFADELQFLQGKYFTARIGRIAKDQRFRFLPESVFQHFRIKGKLRRVQRNVDGLCPGKDRVCTIVFIER